MYPSRLFYYLSLSETPERLYQHSQKWKTCYRKAVHKALSFKMCFHSLKPGLNRSGQRWELDFRARAEERFWTDLCLIDSLLSLIHITGLFTVTFSSNCVSPQINYRGSKPEVSQMCFQMWYLSQLFPKLNLVLHQR